MGFITIDTAEIDGPEDMSRALRFAIESTFDPGDTRIFSDEDNDVNDDEKALPPNASSFRVSDSRGNGTWRVTVTDAECEDTPIRVTRESSKGVRRALDLARKLGMEAAAGILESITDPDAVGRGAVRTLLRLARDLDVDRAVSILSNALSADLHAEEAEPAAAEADEAVLIGLARKVGTIEAVASLASCVAETLALREDVPDDEVDAVRAVEAEYLRRRNA